MTINVKRYKVGNHPTGLLLNEGKIHVLESGKARVITYDLDNGHLLNSVIFPDGVNPYMGYSSIGNTLLAGPNKLAYSWTITSQGTIFSTSNKNIQHQCFLGPYSLRDWVYAPTVRKLIVSQYDSKALQFLPANLSYTISRFFGFEPGALVLSEDGNTVFAADVIGDEIYIIDLKTERITGIIPVGSALKDDFPQNEADLTLRNAPINISSDGQFLYVGSMRADIAELHTPLAIINLNRRRVDVVKDEHIRYPYWIMPNPKLPELYISGYDQTIAIDYAKRRIVHILGEGRLTGFNVAPSGKWAIGVDVYR